MEYVFRLTAYLYISNIYKNKQKNLYAGIISCNALITDVRESKTLVLVFEISVFITPCDNCFCDEFFSPTHVNELT